MKHYAMFEQTDPAEIDALARALPTCLLLTRPAGGADCRAGVFNHIHAGGRFLLHLNKTDEQAADLRAAGRATLVFQDILAVTPSYWVDPRYAGAATSYYRFAEFSCSAALLEGPAEVARALQGMLDRFQPEKGYEPLDPASERYGKSLGTLLIAELTPLSVRAKWKLGQNRPEAARLEVARRLRERGRGDDARAAGEIERWLARRETTGAPTDGAPNAA